MIRAASEVGLKAKLFGGGMVGLQSTAIKTQLGPLLNGIVDYDFWLPVGQAAHAGGEEFLKQYQAKAAAAGVDPLGYYLPPSPTPTCRCCRQAVEGTKSLDQAEARRLPAIPHVQDGGRRHRQFGPGGEWAEARVMEVQFQGVKANDVEQFKQPERRGRPVAARAEDRRRDLPLFHCEN